MASGSVHAELPAGEYLVTLQKLGFGSKRVRMTARPGKVHHFRLLPDGLLGYVWPKWVRSGETGEFRVHSVDRSLSLSDIQKTVWSFFSATSDSK